MLQFLKGNVKHMFAKQSTLTLLLFIVQIFSVIVIVFSYGIINHYNFKVNEKESTTLIYNFLTNVDDAGNLKTVSMEKVDKFMQKVLPYTQDKLDYFFIMGNVKDFGIQCSSGYEAGRFKVSTQIATRTGVISGEKFTDEQMNSSENIVLACVDDVNDEGNVIMDGIEYKAVGMLPDSYPKKYVYMPYKTIPDNTDVYYISLLFEQPLWESEYNAIVDMITDNFEDEFKIPEFDGVINESSNRVYRDIMFVTGFLILVCAVNYCIMYRYILEKRRREFAITRICGCSRYKAGVVYMVELLGMSFFTLVMGLMMYHHWILPEATEHFNYIGLFYSDTVYKTIFGIYMGVLSLTYTFLVCRFVRKTPVALIREV